MGFYEVAFYFIVVQVHAALIDVNDGVALGAVKVVVMSELGNFITSLSIG